VNAGDEGEGEELADRFSVEGYPTFVVVNAEGGTIDRWAGYETADRFIAALARSVADPTTIDQKRARFEQQPTQRDAMALGGYHGSRAEFREATRYYEDALRLGDPTGGQLYDMFDIYAWGHQREELGTEELVAIGERTLDSEELSVRQRMEVARTMSRAARNDDTLSAAPYIDAGLEASEGLEEPDLLDLRRSLLIEHALQVAGDKPRALELKRESLPEGWNDDANQLNGFAWWCFENELNMEEAEALARRGVELADGPDHQAQILDTVAEIVFLRGDRDEAVALIEQAAELDPESDYYREQLTRFSGDDVEVADAQPGD
jgi:tetratricopeptide (TPR) repeat protein